MAFRLRHVQSVTLKRFEPGFQLRRDARLFYELWRGLPDGSQQLLYVSEQVPLDFDLCWQPLSAARCCVPAEQLHMPFGDPLRLTVKTVQPHSAAAAHEDAAAAAPAAGGQGMDPTAPAQPEQPDSQQQVHVRFVKGRFRVLLPGQLQQLLLQQQQQQQKEQAMQAEEVLEDRPVRVCFDAAAGAFRVLVAQPSAGAGVRQTDPQQQCHKHQQQPEQQLPAGGVASIPISSGLQPHSHQLPPQSPPPPRPHQQQPQRSSTFGVQQDLASLVPAQGQLTPLRQQQQQHVSFSVPSLAAAAAAASPSHAAMLRARQQLGGSRSGSSCSDAALQLEQQLLGVFTTGSITGPSQHSSSSFGGSQPQQQQQQLQLGEPAPQQQQQQEEVQADPGQHLRAGRFQPQQQQQQQDLDGFSDVLLLPADAAPSAAAAACSSMGGTDELPLSPCSGSFPSASSQQHARPGKVVMHFAFWLHDLCSCDPQELKTPLLGFQQPSEQQHRNKLLLQLTEGLYTLPPRPQPAQNPAADAPLLSPMASREDFVGAEGFDSLLRLGQLAGNQLSGPLAAVEQQQQLYRWMLSDSTGILDSLEHSYDEEETLEQMGGHHRRGSSAGSALSLLGSLFARRSPAVTAAAAAAAAASGSNGGAADPITVGAAHGTAAAGQQTQRQPSLPSVARGASLAAEGDSSAAVAASSGGSSPQHAGVSTAASVAHILAPGGSSRHRHTGSSTATSTALGVGSILGPAGLSGAAAAAAAAAAAGHRRAQSTSSGGTSWAAAHTSRAPVSPSLAAAHLPQLLAAATAAAAAVAAAEGGGDHSSPVVAAGSTVSESPASSPAAAQLASFSAGVFSPLPPAAPSPSSNSRHTRLGDSLGGSSAATASTAPAPAATTAAAAGGLPGLLQRGFLSGFSFWDWGSADDSVGLAAGGTAAERAAVERQYEVDEFAAATRRLVALYQRLHQVQARRDRVRHKLESLLQQQAAARDQQQRRHIVQQRQQAATRLAALRQQHLGWARADLQAQQQQLLARCEGVKQAAGALSRASGRLCEAASVLEGNAGLGCWKELHAQLVARRNRLVAQLGEAFQVGPASRSPFAAAPLALQLDASWWAVDPDTAASASASDSGEQQQQQQPSALTLVPQVPGVVPGALTHQQQQRLQAVLPPGHPYQQLLQASQHHPLQPQQQQAALSAQPSAPSSSSAAAAGAQPPSPGAVDRLLVGGLELPASLAKRGLQGSMGWGGDLDEEARVAAALGYVAHIVSLLSVYLDVPLRYPLLPSSSRSGIVDPAPVHSQTLETHVHRRFWGMAAATAAVGGGGGSGSSPRGGDAAGFWPQQQQQQMSFDSPVRALPAAAAAAAAASSGQPGALSALVSPGRAAADLLSPSAAAAAAAAAAGDTSGGSGALQLPLFYVTGDRTRFAYAVFLLNKDIEQLLHVLGMSSQGPSQVLANLYKLITAAVSGLPQQQQQRPRTSVQQQQQEQKQQGGAGSKGAGQAATATAVSAAAAAASTAGTDASWLQQLPLPPGHTPQQQQQQPLGQQQIQQPKQQRPPDQQQMQQQHIVSPKQQQQQQRQQQQQHQRGGGGSWWWPWQSDAQQQQQQQQQQAPTLAPQQQQQPVAPSIATWDWDELLAPSTGQHKQQQPAGQKGQQQQQQDSLQHPPANGNSTSFDLHSWQQQNDAQLAAAQGAATAAASAATAATQAADAAARLMLQEGGRACGREQQQQQQQQQQGGAGTVASSRSVTSLLSLKWAGDV